VYSAPKMKASKRGHARQPGPPGQPGPQAASGRGPRGAQRTRPTSARRVRQRTPATMYTSPQGMYIHKVHPQGIPIWYTFSVLETAAYSSFLNSNGEDAREARESHEEHRSAHFKESSPSAQHTLSLHATRSSNLEATTAESAKDRFPISTANCALMSPKKCYESLPALQGCPQTASDKE
jgi:hypothetical protein